MSILFLLIPLGMIFLGAAIWAFLWAVRSGRGGGKQADRDAGERHESVAEWWLRHVQKSSLNYEQKRESSPLF